MNFVLDNISSETVGAIGLFGDAVAKNSMNGDIREVGNMVVEASALCVEQNCDCDVLDRVTCPETGEGVCRNCGLVLNQQVFNEKPELIYPDRDTQRNGPAETPTIHDKGLSTIISPLDCDASMRKIAGKNLPEIYRLRKLQRNTRVHSIFDRSLSLALQQVTRISEKLGLPLNMRQNIAVTYRKALSQKLVRGRGISMMVAASIYYTCRSNGLPRSLNEISKASGIPRKGVSRCYRLLIEKLPFPTPKLVSVGVHISKICSILMISGEVQGKAIEYLTRLPWKATSGKAPRGLAAALVYLACRELQYPRIQVELASAAEVSDVTVRNQKKHLNRYLKVGL